jgi:hypothetical protein
MGEMVGSFIMWGTLVLLFLILGGLLVYLFSAFKIK